MRRDARYSGLAVHPPTIDEHQPTASAAASAAAEHGADGSSAVSSPAAVAKGMLLLSPELRARRLEEHYDLLHVRAARVSPRTRRTTRRLTAPSAAAAAVRRHGLGRASSARCGTACARRRARAWR